jgi:D-aminoacyl-tRNA deacylase
MVPGPHTSWVMRTSAFTQTLSPACPRLYEAFVQRLEQDLGRPVVTGEFGAHMQVALVNDGPVTLWMDTRNRE